MFNPLRTVVTSNPQFLWTGLLSSLVREKGGGGICPLSFLLSFLLVRLPVLPSGGSVFGGLLEG